MIAEYALDPALLGTWNDFRFYISQFGVPHGRLLSEFPTTWKRMVKEVANRAAKDKEFLMITEALDRLEREMITREHDYNDSHSWLKNAIEENKKRPFHAIATTTKKGTTKNLLDGKSLDPTKPHKLWKIPVSIQVKRDAVAMMTCVSLLLSLSDEIVFIDPYFDPGARRYTDPLKLFLHAMANRGRRKMPTRIEYHGGNQNTDKANFQRDLDQWVRPHLPTGVALSVVRWGKDQMHNRYILTDRGGVMFGKGLDDGRDDKFTHDTVSLLDDGVCAELIVDYSIKSQRLTWLNELFSITGT